MGPEEKRVKGSWQEKKTKQEDSIIDLLDIEKHMYIAVISNPDIIIWTSGETRLSNLLSWQSANCLLYSPSILWPEIGFRHLVKAILDFQNHPSSSCFYYFHLLVYSLSRNLKLQYGLLN